LISSNIGILNAFVLLTKKENKIQKNAAQEGEPKYIGYTCGGEQLPNSGSLVGKSPDPR
jgi:hypothetical protein